MVGNTNRLKNFHCKSRTKILVCAQFHKYFLETIELPPLKNIYVIESNVNTFISPLGNPIKSNGCGVFQYILSLHEKQDERSKVVYQH